MDKSTFEDIRSKLVFSRMGRPALVGIVAVLVVVTVLAGKHIADTATATEFQVQQAAAQEQPIDVAAEPESVYVHVSGAVNQPGLCEVPRGARLAEAIQAAGGFAEGANVDSVNLARIVDDGEQIMVLTLQPAQDGSGASGGQGASGNGALDSASTGTTGEAGATSPNGAGANGSANASGKVNINTAAQSELESLPGIGPSTAAKIVADRAANGAFASIDDLTRVSGIGAKKLEGLRDFACV